MTILTLETPERSAGYRATKLAVLRKLVVKHIERTDAQARNVEKALAVLAEANAGSRGVQS